MSLSSNGKDKIEVPVRDALFQLARALPSENQSHEFSWNTTVGELAKEVLKVVHDVKHPVVLVKDFRSTASSNPNNRKYITLDSPVGTALEPVQSPPLIIRSPNTVQEFLPPNRTSQTSVGKECIRNMWNKYKDIMHLDPYMLNITPHLFERVLPSIPLAILLLSGINAPLDAPVCSIPEHTLLLWGTGCHITTISVDLITPAFRQYVQGPAYESRTSDLTIISVDAKLQLSNTSIDMSFIARIVPMERMPNRMSGVLLGQVGLINCIEVRQIPRQLLIEDGQEVPEHIWGDLVVEQYLDAGTGIVHRFLGIC